MHCYVSSETMEKKCFQICEILVFLLRFCCYNLCEILLDSPLFLHGTIKTIKLLMAIEFFQNQICINNNYYCFTQIWA